MSAITELRVLWDRGGERQREKGREKKRGNKHHQWHLWLAGWPWHMSVGGRGRDLGTFFPGSILLEK